MERKEMKKIEREAELLKREEAGELMGVLIHAKVDEERPLVQEDSDQLPSPRNEPLNFHTPEGSHLQTEGNYSSPGSHSLTYKQRLPPPVPHLTQGMLLFLFILSNNSFCFGGSLVLDIGDQAEDLVVGQTLRRPLLTSHNPEEQKCNVKEDPNHDSRFKPEDVKLHSFTRDQGSCLSLEVITGPACGLRCSVWSTDASKLPLTLGRVPPSDVLLKDSEVSGKHAMINWNSNKLKWELVDLGSLNGTLLNTKAVHHPDFGSRTWGEPKELVGGDVITLGTTSQISVQITPLTQSENPVGVGIASDPMSTRRGGKRLPMEDVCYYQWPLPGAEQFGLFGICDGHGGAAAALSASNFFAQCANVGDSACVMNIDGRQIKMTEDHRISSYSERQRISESGNPLKDGDTRLCGLNLGRMLGDKFLKEQDARFSSEPYISQVVRVGQASEAFAVLASDGLWDVISAKKASQFVLQVAKERYSSDRKGSAQKIANFLLNEARKLRTKDNTSVVYVDFDTALRTLCKYEP
uniref:protein-serine/threonine phosphatase n=1 Tax=Chenopodium quinoa TaxID=63459 RepID=A0A803NBH5_CHEQI